jgi:hypothetical protein
VGPDKRLKFLPPLNAPSLHAQDADESDHVLDLIFSKRGLEGRHDPFALLDHPANLKYALSLDGIAEIGNMSRQRSSDGTVPPAGGSVASQAALGIEDLHLLFTQTPGKEEN